jgi:hypothetical protein
VTPRARRLLALSALQLLGCDLVSKANKSDAAATSAARIDAGVATVASAAAATSVDAATKPAVSYAVFAGPLGPKTSFRLAIERSGADVRAVFDMGAPLAMIGKMTDDTHVRVQSAKVAKGEKPATLNAELGASSLTGTFTDAIGNSQKLASTSAAALPATFDGEYVGTIGKLFVRAKLSRHTGALSGVYRYAASPSDLELDGTVHDDRRFELAEKSSGKVTGKIVGAFASTGGILGQWQSADSPPAKTAPLSLERGSGYPETRTYDEGLVLYAQERMIEGKGCRTDVVFPQIRGVADAARMKAVNDYLRGDIGKTKSCEGPESSALADFDSAEGYALDTTKGRFVGLRRSGYSYAGGAHGIGGSQCDVVDAKAVTHFQLASKLSEPGRAKLSDLVVAALAKQYKVAKLTDANFLDDKVTITKDSDLCLGEEWVEVSFNAYDIGPSDLGPQQARFPFAQVKDLFVKDDVTAAMFGGPRP